MDIRAHVVALNTKRAKAAKELNDHVDECHKAHPGEPFTAEERQTFDRINAEIDTIEAEVRDFVSVETREQDAAKLREANESLFGERAVEKAERSEADAIRSFLRGNGTKELEIDMARAIHAREAMRSGAGGKELRALLWDTGSIGSAVPTLFASALYEVMEAEIAMFKAPTTKVVTANGDSMSFPKVATHGIGTQVIAQGTAIGGTDPVFDKLTLDAFKYGELCQVSSESIDDPVFDVTGFVARDLARAVGRVIDADLVVGTGSGEPKGIMAVNTGSGTIVTGGSLINATYENLVDLVYSVNDAYRSRAAGFLMKDATAGQLRKLRDGAGGTVGAVLWEPSLTSGIQNGQPDRLLGFPVYTDPNVAAQGSAAKSILFGDFSSYYVRLVGSLKVERSDEYAFNTDLVTFRGKWRADGDTIDSTATNLLTNRVS